MFAEKFRLLSSQGSVQEISWSSSDSSDYENVSSNIDKNCNKSKKSRKRKRKHKVPKNMSNLDITFVDTTKDQNTTSNIIKAEKVEVGSPILCTSEYFPPYKYTNLPISPILMPKYTDTQDKLEKTMKSPILILKTASPKVSPKVRKKLFDIAAKDKNHTPRLQIKSKSTTDSLDRRKFNEKVPDTSRSLNLTYNIKTEQNNFHSNEIPIVNNEDSKEKFVPHLEDQLKPKIKLESKEVDLNYTIQETPEDMKLDDSIAMLKTSSKDLASKVKSYFDSHFSSENSSQQTISDIPTQKNNSRTSDEIEIVNTITQLPSNKNSCEVVTESPECNKKDKKLRYKKDGLAYRLNSLLKKQTASVSLWQHERFLAANSDFVIPKGEFKPFRLCKISFKYGVCLLEAMDFNDDKFLILINRSFLSNDNLKENAVFKLYDPYRIMDFQSDCKLILNVCKFECVDIPN